MQAALRVTTTVQAGGKIEIEDPQLPSGEDVDVIVLFPGSPAARRRSIGEVLAEAPGRLLFRTPTDVDHFLREERDEWER
jgi:hypothetical protein